MHNAPPVIYPVGRCAVCAYAFYVVGVLQLLVMAGAAYASQPIAGARWSWFLAGMVLLVWLFANVVVDKRAAKRRAAAPPQSGLRYLAWQHAGPDGVWQIQTQHYGEPVPLLSTFVALDTGSCMLVRVNAPRSGIQWLWLFERDSPQRWLAMRRALMALRSG